MLVVFVVAVCTVVTVIWIIDEGKQYVSDEPVPVTAFEPTAGQVAEVAERVDDFVAAAQSKTTDQAARVALSADDLNALLASGGKRIAGDVFVQKIEKGEVWVELSVSLDGVPRFDGQYFNGIAVVNGFERKGPYWAPTAKSIETRDGVVVSRVIVDAMEHFMGPAIREALSRVKGPDSEAKDFYTQVFSERGDIRIEGGKIVLEVEAALEDQ